MDVQKKIQDDLTAARNLLGLSGDTNVDTATATLCAQQAIAGSLIVIATILDRVTRHGERVDVSAECSVQGV